ncbi:peptidylprolyl isomerase [Spirulina sp. CS-785/01]|uniref:peptidylprolyl isomerase n=1 Tax=Spirulina sp. CS-785/01 TaxID=3021716 RepID=UPI00232E379E|nr:peptidylprolyl isomerase [Spirulina sp. CS-785/01]MDB9315683.1 peptidylprolyl isomerase [Spirulina sp. CS-785/01]
MSAVLQLGKHKLGAEDVVSLLTSPEVLPHLLRELVIEQAIASITYTSQELEQFRQHLQKQAPNTVSAEQISLLAPRKLKIEKFKEDQWGDVVEAEFLSNKEKYDRVVFSLIQSEDMEVVQELYFRLQEGEANFSELAAQYSQGPEAQSQGMVGPMEVKNLHPKLAQVLRTSQRGQLTAPFRVDRWIAIARLERYITTDFTTPLRQRLLNEKFETWVQQQIQQQSQGTISVSKDLQVPPLDTTLPNKASQTAPESPQSDETPPQSPNTPPPPTPPLQLQKEPRHQRLNETLVLSLIPFALAGWSVAALLGFSRQPEIFTANNEDEDAELTTETHATPSNGLGVGRQEAFRVAVNNATEAANLTQTAKTPQEWNQVAQHWQNAIALMRIVPPNSKDYPLAQKKVIEYQGNLEYAQQQAKKSDNLFQASLERAAEAVVFSRTARSLTDWKKAANHWENAISLMQQIPKGQPNYIKAQQKLMEYEAYLQFAQMKAQNVLSR